MLFGIFNMKRSLEDFQLIDKEPIDNSVIKRDFLKVCHQQGAQLNQSNQNKAFFR